MRAEPPSTAGARSGPGSAGPGSSGSGGSAHTLGGSPYGLCAFRIGPRCYAFDIALVSEVVTVETLMPVPLAPREVVGIFNLRGVPVALLDLSKVLELSDRSTAPNNGTHTALVIAEGKEIQGAVCVDRVEGILGAGVGTFTPPNWVHEHPAVEGFLDVTIRVPLVVTVLGHRELTSRLEKLKYR